MDEILSDSLLAIEIEEGNLNNDISIYSEFLIDNTIVHINSDLVNYVYYNSTSIEAFEMSFDSQSDDFDDISSEIFVSRNSFCSTPAKNCHIKKSKKNKLLFKEAIGSKFAVESILESSNIFLDSSKI